MPSREWFLVSKPLRRPFGDGTSVLVRTLVDALPHEQKLAYFGDATAPRRKGAGDFVIDKAAMGHAPGLAQKVGVLAELLRPRHRKRGLHFFFTPNTVTSQVLARLRKLSRKRPIVQTVTSSHGVEAQARLLAELDAVVVMSEHTRGRLIDVGLDPQRVLTVHPAVPSSETRAELESRRLLYAGDLDPTTARRLVALGKALAGTPWTLIIACRPKGEGDAEARASVRSELAAGLEVGRVELHGSVEDFEALRASCGVQLFVADHVRRKVDLPLVVLEGLARGQALLSLDFEPMSELGRIADDAGAPVGAFFAEAQFVEGVLAALGDEATLRAWQEAGPRLIAERFSTVGMAQAHLELYARLG